jgi:hypothetical protein
MIFIVNKNREAMDSELKSMPVSERAREGRGRHRQKGQRWGSHTKKTVLTAVTVPGQEMWILGKKVSMTGLWATGQRALC